MYNIEAGKSWSDLPQVRKKHQYLTSETSTDIRFFNVKARSNSIAKLKGNSAWDPVLTQIASAPDRQTDEQTTHTIEEVWRAYFYCIRLKNLNIIIHKFTIPYVCSHLLVNSNSAFESPSFTSTTSKISSSFKCSNPNNFNDRQFKSANLSETHVCHLIFHIYKFQVPSRHILILIWFANQFRQL